MVETYKKDMTFQRKIRSAIVLVISLLFIGTVMYSLLEGWNPIDSLYFSTVTLTTIGYGDLHPTTMISKLFTIVYILGGVSTMLYVLSILAAHYVENHQPEVEKRVKETLEKIPFNQEKKPDRWITLRMKNSENKKEL